jgi:hypothetical protein
MSNTLKQILVPGFLKKIDQQLLLKHPLIWNSKIHYVAYYTLLTWIAMALFGLLVSGEALHSDFIGFYWLLSVLSVSQVLLFGWCLCLDITAPSSLVTVLLGANG